MEEKKETFVIIDGNAIVHRAYHALPPMTTKDGTSVNAVYGFASMLLKVFSDLKPTYLAVSFDVSGPTFRDTLYEQYKAKRVKADQDLYDQIPIVHELVKSFHIPIFVKSGFEADDVIGTLSHAVAEQKGMLTIIVTGDMDMLQLVDDDIVEVYLLRKGLSDMELYNEDKVVGRFGFGPTRIVDYKAMRGDTSDNIPGISGIGEKIAVEIIEKFGGIDELYNALKKDADMVAAKLKPAVFKKIVAGEKDARMSFELATIRKDVPDLSFDLSAGDVAKLDIIGGKHFLQRLEFFSLIKRLPGEAAVGGVQQKTSAKTAKKETAVSVTKIATTQDVAALKKTIKTAGTFSASVNERKVLIAVEKEIFETDIALAADLFLDPEVTLVGHDVKQILKVLFAGQHEVKTKLFDIMIASYLVNASRAHDLSSILAREIGREPASEQASLFGPASHERAEELLALHTVAEKFEKELQDDDNKGLFDALEMALVPALARMELHGIAVDLAQLKDMAKEFEETETRLIKEICALAGEEFNVASSVQLRAILFEKMKLPTFGIKKGKTGYSTAAPELEKLRDAHPIISKIEEHREVAKLRNTYVDVLPTLIHKDTGRIHTSFNQAVAATGRLSSSDPNLQNIPIRTGMGRRIREAFVAAPGYTLIAADYSQIELRIVASLAQDKRLIEIFEKGEDVHRATAAAIHGVPLEAVTKELRHSAKEINFGVLYGMGAYGLSWRAGISQKDAKAFIETYFREFSGVKAYMDRTLESARETGYVETLVGRRRYIPELVSSNHQLRAAGERMAVNMPIQGTAADVMKQAMIDCDAWIQNEFGQWSSDVKLLLQVHDELVFEVKAALADQVAAAVKEKMEQAVKLRVPIVVEVAIGKSWGKIK